MTKLASCVIESETASAYISIYDQRECADRLLVEINGGFRTIDDFEMAYDIAIKIAKKFGCDNLYCPNATLYRDIIFKEGQDYFEGFNLENCDMIVEASEKISKENSTEHTLEQIRNTIDENIFKRD